MCLELKCLEIITGMISPGLLLLSGSVAKRHRVQRGPDEDGAQTEHRHSIGTLKPALLSFALRCVPRFVLSRAFQIEFCALHVGYVLSALSEFTLCYLFTWRRPFWRQTDFGILTRFIGDLFLGAARLR
jgi:hypothetical protein